MDKIVAEIRAAGPMTFARYMELCLYDPAGGYYRGERERFGAAGDFYTSAQVHPAFARLLVSRWREMWIELGGGPFTLLEAGAGRGELAREAQVWAERTFPDFHSALRYRTLEYGDPLPTPFTGCIFSNEFFDAQPVHVLAVRNGRLRELFVIEKKDGLGWHGVPERSLRLADGELSSPGLARWVKRLGIEPAEGRVFELSPAAAEWMARFSAVLDRGYLLAFDYGYGVRELNAGRFAGGSLMTYRKHVATAGLFLEPGGRDITAHVNFDLLAEAGGDCGLSETRRTTQGRYLMDLGEATQFSEVFADCRSDADRAKATLLLKNLLFGIGETIQVLEMKKSAS